MIIFILISLALTCFGSLALAGGGFNRRTTNLEALETGLLIIDLKAFQRLMDRAETEFLRTHLGPSQFRTAERCRIRAAMGYLKAISQNARILLAIGALAKESGNERIADAAQELIDTALHTRLFAMAMYARLLPAWLFPSTQGVPLDKVLTGYEQMKDQLLYLVSVEKPMMTSRAASLL